MWSQSISIWLKAIYFYLANLVHFLPVFPLLYVPFLGDLLLSVMIKQKLQNGRVSSFNAIGECCPYMKTFVSLKITFAVFSGIGGDVPVLGEYLEIKYARYKAMLSNVMVFENVKDKKTCKARCQSLVYGKGVAIRTIYTLPLLLFCAFLVAWTYYVSEYQPSHPILLLFVPLILYKPLSDAVNTFLFLELVKEQNGNLINIS